ncbi:hypothetical protein KF728_11310 [Candidatus Obscuribacterales bacterium]|nr:hypothetical protein [Candidatus Obscuribacterales bacterium]
MSPSQSNIELGDTDEQRFPFWELDGEHAKDVETLLPLWVSHLESVYQQLAALSTEDLGGYLEVRIYEDNLFIDDDLLTRLGATGIGMSIWFNPPEQITWTQPDHLSTLAIPQPTSYYCQLDEAHFFKWLQEIDGVKEVRGHSVGLTVYLSVSALSDYALRDLIGLLFRYDVPMSFLRSQITSGNEHWFKDPGTYWYEKIFGET